MKTNNSLCFVRCLGSHVKKIEFKNFDLEQDLCTMMQLLFSWGCDQVTSLGTKVVEQQ